MSKGNVVEAMQSAVLIVGFGDIGQRVARLLSPTHRVIALIRRADREADVRAVGATPLIADLDDAASLHGLAGIAGVPIAVLHFAPPPNHGAEDSRTTNLLAALSMGVTPECLIYISTTGVYGDCQGRWIDERSPLNPESDRATRRVDAEQRLTTWARATDVGLAILRAPGIYAADRLPIERLRAGTPVVAAAEDAWSNHIHADDLAAAAVHAMAYTGGSATRSTSVFNIVDDSELKMGDYFDLVADHVGLPRPPRVSRIDAGSQVSAAMLSFMRESRRIRNQKMKSELAMTLAYPTVQLFLRGLAKPTD